MRLWSLHPAQLDRVGLIACWRESLLAQAVLAGRTRGYRNHPQLVRFQGSAARALIGGYLTGLHEDSVARGYRFDASRILEPGAASGLLSVTEGQLEHEWQHLGRKLAERSPADHERWSGTQPHPHPLFAVVPGSIEPWERLS